MATDSLSYMQLPTLGVLAFTPLRAQSGTAATNGVWEVTGSPGVVPVPVPRPNGLPPTNGGPTPYSTQGGAPSGGGALYIRPDIYVVRNRAPVGVVSTVSDNVLPTPAQDTVRVARAWMRRVRTGGRTVTAWPRPTVSWPTFGGGTSG